MNCADQADHEGSLSRTVGSTFAAEALVDRPEGVTPWAGLDIPAYVQSGGQAIRLISEHLWAEGRRRLQLPGFLCESMLEPFTSRPWKLTFYPTGPDLQPALERVEIDKGQGLETVALAAAYFGRHLTSNSSDALVELQAQGVCVVEDRTHNLFGWSGSPPDYAFASLRKMLPVGDGAVVVGGPWVFAPDELGPGTVYWSAMDLKARRDEHVDEASRRLFAIAETRFQNELEPCGASSRTVERLRGMDYKGMAEARRSNALVLSERLNGFVHVHEVLDYQVPSHLVVRVEDPVAVQRTLAAVGIFCPVHWPKPSRVPAELEWPAGMLSLPVDHRYDVSDMEYVATSVKQVAHHD